jgi:tetratricopeptide (TPR) repeat protein
VHHVRSILLAGAALWAQPAMAADALKFGAPPAWVRPQPIPAAKSSEAPIALLLNDQQVALEHGKVTAFTEAALKIENDQGLAAGNLAVVWQPATDTVTVNKLQIRRGDKVIDVLAGGQTFTVLRRETNLEAATLDGTLTATLQPEGLQVGDIIDLATTIEHSDPVLKGHVETMFGAWDGLPIQAAHAALSWPSDIHLYVRQTPNLPAAQRSLSKGVNLLELSSANVEPLIDPKGAPQRFRIGRLAEATDFASWSDLANLFIPLFRNASAMPASGPLHDELEHIRTASADPKTRAQLALALVQDRVRYVALLMGQGGYVPAAAETTWSRRFGDCKAKTALLLGILHSLGIEAEPVLVQAKLGDMIADRSPMIDLFNHVLVRAHIGAKTYYLDGTRSGDTDLDSIEVPDFGWGLPLVEHAELVHMVPKPLDQPRVERRVNIDASAGVYTAAPVVIDEIYRGDSAVAFNTLYSAVTAQQRDEALHDKAKGYFDDFTVSTSSIKFDKAKRELDLTIRGTAKLNWKDGWFYIPTSSIAFDPDFDRRAGPLHDVPLAVDHPRYARDKVTFALPPGFASTQKLTAQVHELLAGVEYGRSELVNGNILTIESSERSILSEVPYKEALAAAPRLRTLDRDDVYLRVDPSYRPTEPDLAALKATKPQSADDYFVRAYAELTHNGREEALADLDAGLALDPKNTWALKKRAWINIGKQHFPEAEADLQAAASIDPDDADLIASRGELAISKGDIGAASAAFDQALQKDPKNSVARAGRANILLQQGKIDESLSELTTALVSEPHNATALALRAQILESRNDRVGADRDIGAALAAEPDNAIVLATRAAIAVDRRDYDAAKKFVADSLAHDPNNSVARSLQAALLKREGNEGQALQSFDAAVANSPHDASALLNRAYALIEAKQFDAAEKDVSAALALEPKNLRALKARAAIASAKGDFSGATEALTTVLAASPLDGSILEARADAYRRLHKFDLALADTDTAMKTGLISPSLRLLRINILVGDGDVSGVAPEVEQLLKENPTSDFALVVAGKTYAAIGMREKAMASFDRALAIKPYAYIYLNRSQVRPYSDLQGKLADIDAALKLEPDQEDALAEKAHLLSRAGKHAEAIDLYDRAIKGALDRSNLELGRAIALQKAGRVAEAKTGFDGVQEKAKTVGDFSRMCWAKAVDDVLLESALEDCRHALILDPKYPALNESLGLVLLKLGKLQEALVALNKAVDEKSGAEAYLIRAITRSRLGDQAGARGDAVEAHRLRADVDDRVADYGLKFNQTSSSVASTAR